VFGEEKKKKKNCQEGGGGGGEGLHSLAKRLAIGQ